MKVWRYQFNRLTLRRTWIRRIKPLIDYHYSLDHSGTWGDTAPIDVFATNVCNLKCFSCSALCDKPFGDNLLRRNPWIVGLGDYEDFLIAAKELGAWVQLTGGEITTMPLDHLADLVCLAHDYGYKVNFLSNAFKLPDYLLKYIVAYPDAVTLDRHGTNDKEIKQSANMLRYRHIPYNVLDVLEHRDLQYQRETNITRGAACSIFLKNISVAHQVIYPCCAACVVEAWDNTDKVSDALFNAGWNIHNPDLKDTVKNWRKTLPAEWFKLCMLSCWMDGNSIRYESNVPKG